jgi:uncharacterized protein YbjT (DUF2867 family)
VVAVIAQALLDDDLQERHIEVTGPQSRTHEEMAGIIGEVIGRPSDSRRAPQETRDRLPRRAYLRMSCLRGIA